MNNFMDFENELKAMSKDKLLSDDGLRAEIASILLLDRQAMEHYVSVVDDLINLINTQKRLYAESEKLALIDKLNKDMFYSDANPSGQHVKNCLMAEYDALQPMPQSQIEQIEYGKFRRAEQRARIR